MAITNASRIADFSSGIGTVGAGIQIDNTNHRVIVGNGNSTTLEVSGIVSATAFSGHLIGNVTGTSSTSTVAITAYGLSGTPNITVGTIAATSLNASGVVTATSFVGSGANCVGRLYCALCKQQHRAALVGCSPPVYRHDAVVVFCNGRLSH